VEKYSHSLSQKKDSQHFSCNSSNYYPILIIFGKNFTKKVDTKRCFIFPPQITSVLHYLQMRKHGNCIFYVTCCMLRFANKIHRLPFDHNGTNLHSQNDGLYALNRAKKGSMESSCLICTHSKFTKSVMLPTIVSKMGEFLH